MSTGPLLLLLYVIAVEALVISINANKRIKGILIGDHEIKLVNFADDITISLGDTICFNRIQVILKLHEKASNSKTNFSNRQVL